MSMNGCPLREWESDQIRMEATQVEVNFLAKAIIGDFYFKLSKSQYTLQIALLITSGGTTPHPGQPMLAGVPILSQQWVYTSGGCRIRRLAWVRHFSAKLSESIAFMNFSS